MWTCLGCGKTTEEFDLEIMAVYCSCTECNYACHDCYKKNPGYDYWSKKFGPNHSIKDTVANDSSLMRMLNGILNGNLTGIDAYKSGNVTLYAINGNETIPPTIEKKEFDDPDDMSNVNVD